MTLLQGVFIGIINALGGLARIVTPIWSKYIYVYVVCMHGTPCKGLCISVHAAFSYSLCIPKYSIPFTSGKLLLL